MHRQSTLAILFAALLTLTPHAASAAESAPVVASRQADTPASCTPAPTDDPLTITGRGQSQSLPFDLGGGAYTVAWSMTEPSTMLSFIRLDSTTDPSALASQVILNGNGKDGTAGQTAIYKVKPGRYYLSVRAPSDWSVTLTPIAP